MCSADALIQKMFLDIITYFRHVLTQIRHLNLALMLFKALHSKLLTELFCKIFASSKIPVISKKILNFENQTFPKLVKTKSSEISV